MLWFVNCSKMSLIGPPVGGVYKIATEGREVPEFEWPFVDIQSKRLLNRLSVLHHNGWKLNEFKQQAQLIQKFDDGKRREASICLRELEDMPPSSFANIILQYHDYDIAIIPDEPVDAFTMERL